MNENVQVSENRLQKVLELLNRLDRAKIHYRLAHNQDDAISVEAAVPGQRWEIDFYADGTMDVEIFKSDGSIHDENILDRLLRDFSD